MVEGLNSALYEHSWMQVVTRSIVDLISRPVCQACCFFKAHVL
jgi:hypothetical protein